MQAIRRSDTRPEVALRSALHKAGLRFRKDHVLRLEGVRVRPDIVFTRARLAVFVDGCFWHSCPTHGRSPLSNQAYWAPKLRRNAERDRRQDEALIVSGWEVVRIWEHEELQEALRRISAVYAERLTEEAHTPPALHTQPGVVQDR
jgi:DNA mismatch endonuclease (patch repair protein)